MLNFMDYIQQAFHNAVGWGADGSYEHILRNSSSLLDFEPPSGIKLAINNRNTPFSYSSLEINQQSRLSGSLSYMYSSIDLEPFYFASKSVKLQEMIQSYRDILKPLHSIPNGSRYYNKKSHLLLYGKLYFPSQLLEGMIIKKFSESDQLIVKFVNTQKLNRMSQSTSILTLYWQRKLNNSFHDFIYSTHESLLGYRCLYSFDYLSPTAISTKFQVPSKVSLGCELWYAAATISPGASIAARYTTYMLRPNHKSKKYINALSSIQQAKNEQPLPPHHNIHINHLLTNDELAKQQQHLDSGLNDIDSSNYGLNPFTVTLAVNPLLGTIVSSYAVSSSNHGLTLSSRYIFNIYSYESDLVLGAHFLRTSTNWGLKDRNFDTVNSSEDIIIKNQQPTSEYLKDKIREHPILQAVTDYSIVKAVTKGYDPTSTPISPQTIQKPPMILTVNESDDEFISSLKLSTSVHKKTSTFAWEGKFKDWLISSGVSVDFKHQVPKFKGYGIELQYTS